MVIPDREALPTVYPRGVPENDDQENAEELDSLREPLGQAAAAGNDEAAELLGHVDAYLSEGQESPEKKKSLIARLNDAALGYESSHPTLSTAIARVSDFFSAEGI